jgi:hypothetical protein
MHCRTPAAAQGQGRSALACNSGKQPAYSDTDAYMPAALGHQLHMANYGKSTSSVQLHCTVLLTFMPSE